MSDQFPTYLRNRHPFLNRFSPFASTACLGTTREHGHFVDPHYGYGWDLNIKRGDAVYGIAEAFVPGPLDHLGTGQFTRTPYRRIPRIRISSLAQLKDFVAETEPRRNETTLMWRGQVQEHNLERSETDRLKLYGAADAREPSLVPSASRPSALRFETYMESWLGLIELYIEERLTELSSIYSHSTIRSLRSETERWQNNYSFKLWGFAAAQHYGLPSPGLDLTTNIDVALFFALHRFTPTDGGRVDISRIAQSSTPVIYMLGVHDGDLLADEDIGPKWLQTLRAKAQSAHFFSTAWGDASNKAAEKIAAVLELHDHAFWDIGEMRPRLFPLRSEDPFASFLSEASSRFPAIVGLVPIHRVYHWA